MTAYRLTSSIWLTASACELPRCFGRGLHPYGISVPMYRVLAALSEVSDQRLYDLAVVPSVEVSPCPDW
jgi:hypothetical protein